MELSPHQLQAIEKLQNGMILCGDVGTGKSRTALAYYYSKVIGGTIKINEKGSWGAPTAPRDLYVITTAKKRDDHDWEKELEPFLETATIKMTVDSWNNIEKYKHISDCFFVFDEQRISSGKKWARMFLEISQKNQWIMLTATPGDKWIEWAYVFIANGFFKNITDFYNRHCIFDPYTQYRSIKEYRNEELLEKYRDQIVLVMEFQKVTVPIHDDVYFPYNKNLYRKIFRDRWNPWDNCPIDETGKLCYLLRRAVNSEERRLYELFKIVKERKRVICFYNYNYELEAIKQWLGPHILIAEWNGHKHDSVPDQNEWLYLVQYTAGAEGWNCITSDCIVFYSLSYSYKQTIQAAGRIDRLNTPYTYLYYYHFKSYAPIDVAISRALKTKKDFNERTFLNSKKYIRL
jgi:hypothetical protein